MELMLERLKRRIDEFEGFVIYGAGNYAHELMLSLDKMEREPIFLVVTKIDDTLKSTPKNIPVYNIDDIAEEIKKKNYLVLIAVSHGFQKEICEILNTKQIDIFSCITDYDRRDQGHINYLTRISKSQFIDNLNDWQTKCTTAQLHDPMDNKRGIIFIVGAVTPRMLKIAKTLTEEEITIRLLVSPKGIIQDFCKDELEHLCIETVICTSIEQMFCEIIQSTPWRIHLFTHRDHSDIDRLILKYKDLMAPVIYDEYDIINGCYSGIGENEEAFGNEKFCIENADGICNRGYEFIFLQDECDIKINGAYIQFPDYCRNTLISCASDSNTLSLCYVGGLISTIEGPKGIAEAFFRCMELCEENGCYLYIYPTAYDEVAYRDYFEYEKGNPFVKIMRPLPYQKLQYEIAKYDYGISPQTKHLLTNSAWRYTEKKPVYAATNKFYDYLDAGLPIVAGTPVLQAQELEEMGVLFNWTIEEYDFTILRERKKEMKEAVKRLHDSLSIKNHIHSLIDFYDKCEREIV